MQVIIDRFEGDFAVAELDSGKCVNLPRELVPDAAEGDVVDITVNKDATAARKNKIKNLMNDLFTD